MTCDLYHHLNWHILTCERSALLPTLESPSKGNLCTSITYSGKRKW